MTTVGGTESVAGAFTYFSSPFTDEPLQAGTPVKALHFTELRTRIDELRLRYGLDGFAWTDLTLFPGATPVAAMHLAELRTALQAVYAAAGRTPPTYTDASLGPAMTIRVAHIVELRAAILAIE